MRTTRLHQPTTSREGRSSSEQVWTGLQFSAPEFQCIMGNGHLASSHEQNDTDRQTWPKTLPSRNFIGTR